MQTNTALEHNFQTSPIWICASNPWLAVICYRCACLVKYEKAGLICYWCACLGHKENSYIHQSFLEGSPTAFSFLEGFPAFDSSSMKRLSTTSGKTSLLGANIGAQGKISSIQPKNLIQDLNASLLGSRSRITKLDQEQEITSTPFKVNAEHHKIQCAQVKSSHKPLYPRTSLISPARYVHSLVEHLISEKTDGDSPPGYNKGVDFFYQTYVFKAAENVSLHVTRTW